MNIFAWQSASPSMIPIKIIVLINSNITVISRLTPKRMAKARRRREIGKTKLGIRFPHLKKKYCQKHNGPKTKREIGKSKFGISFPHL